MTMYENYNTVHARIVCSTDDDNNDACHAPTTFNQASNANNITDTSIVFVTFPLLNIRDPGEDEDFIGPDGQANSLPEGFSVAPRTAVDVSRHVDTALTPPTTEDYSVIPVVTNMTHVEHVDLVTGDLHQANHFLLAFLGYQWMMLFMNTSLQTHTSPPTPALIMRLMLPQKIEDW
jgi:hypothetical protein